MRLNRCSWLFLLILITLILLLTSKIIHLWRPHLSYWLKHTPLCIAENAGLLNPRRAHYVREIQSTVDVLYCTPSKPPKLIRGQMSHDLIVISGMGGVVQRINSDGHLVWQSIMRGPRSIDIQDDKLLVGEGKFLHFMNLSTGEKLTSFEFDQPILSARLRGNTLFTVMDIKGIGSVRSYELLNNQVKLINSASVEATYPRGIDVDEHNIYIADTFGNRILRLDRGSLSLKAEVPSYFPNSVQVNGESLIVSEEHSNVVSEFKINPLERSKVLVGCPDHLLLNNVEKKSETYMGKKLKCQQIKSVAELYSPNDAALLDGHLYIADTDNHRIIQITKGAVIAELIGFNDPVSVRAIKH
jgi:hypothetical protein